MRSIREVKESPYEVGLDEHPVISLTTTPWGASPASVSAKAYKYENGAYTDVTSTVLPQGVAAATGDVITLPALVPQAEGDIYRIEIKFTINTSPLEAYAIVNVRR